MIIIQRYGQAEDTVYSTINTARSRQPEVKRRLEIQYSYEVHVKHDNLMIYGT